ITLDDEQSRQFANDDPGGFMRGLERAVIDEVQRAPGLILVLKKTVDEDPRPGRFLITGSVDLFKGTISPDSLAGRVETIKLLPFSQSEIVRRKPPGFFEKAFGVDFPTLKETGRTTDLIKRVIAGGYPEALMRQDERRRQTWLRSYASALTTRDVAEILPVFKTDELSRLLNHAAVSSGELVNLSALAAPLGVDSKKINRWMNLLEQMFIL
ncbi:MAG: ATP-binding protein, partial [Hyphomonadaceae bacterium]|nr:ATP-binding protein [Hyphomonadaceae bacterium]